MRMSLQSSDLPMTLPAPSISGALRSPQSLPRRLSCALVISLMALLAAACSTNRDGALRQPEQLQRESMRRTAMPERRLYRSQPLRTLRPRPR